MKVNRWPADTEPWPRPGDTDTAIYGAVARKPASSPEPGITYLSGTSR
jgi:hypothetical protein